jgi:hypothetical protein
VRTQLASGQLSGSLKSFRKKFRKLLHADQSTTSGTFYRTAWDPGKNQWKKFHRIHAHKQKLMDAEQFANWLMDISDELNSIAQEIEVDAESYFVFTYEIEADAEFENRQDFSEKKAAYLERLLRQIPERIKKADQLTTG